MQYLTRRTAIVSGIVAIGGLALGTKVSAAQQAENGSPTFDASKNPTLEKIAPYKARFGRARPLVAVVALNEGTVISDFCIPFGVMARADVADVVSVSVKPGPVKMHPLTFELQSTIDDFDKRFPEGADYLFVPAVSNFKDASLSKWVKAQSEKGGTIISICYGALPVANAGLFDGRRATSHYSTEEMRVELFPKVNWQKNIRYVADGKFVSSAGVTASMPTSIALIEAIAGPEKAAEVAHDVGIDNWDSRHNSDVFKSDPDNADMPDANTKPEITIGIPVKAGDDEIALSLTAEAYSTTGITTALAVAESKARFTLAHGLVVIPDVVTGGSKSVDRMLAPLDAHHATRALDIALTDIHKTYGRKAARHVALFMEYPGFAG
ncbi:DJ-1/PfpI family protein [Rhizobium skierniewicense]|uniref:DJ-1/PfpI family protein n=1 Tax=Rhizobium skierniewicense TaxID=984260 RepID=UPI001FAE3B26|nr:DJ-1/PfpI family protein [Rhizobium skierniewicense]MCI9868419.1 DJ-1/PfpI family protein [Rhizobium skierniewicense]